ncbi:myoD family inhibitor [Protopterus annectens]|uniref:myoD family inhibitor n=1 Tax=Protopterus annectens TaxID=7888 RepID=UPI001CFB7633|nr:myoD family inhibitor [Protopterus annectens]
MSQVRTDPPGLADSSESNAGAVQDEALSPLRGAEAESDLEQDEDKSLTPTGNTEDKTLLPPLTNGTVCWHKKTDMSAVTDEPVACQPLVKSNLKSALGNAEVPEAATDVLLTSDKGHVSGQIDMRHTAVNGTPSHVIQCPPTSQTSHKKLQSNPSINSHSSKKSRSSSKSVASQIPADAHEDCCVHCILACLFCEFLTLCNIVLDCATCGTCASDDTCGLCCCCCATGECGGCALPCDLDCGLVDACCESADCLEICMECCGLCFSS